MPARTARYATVVALLACAATAAASADDSLVLTASGAVRGKLTAEGREFLGIPYAQPPVGNMRWRPPAVANAWAPAVLDAAQQPPGCPQNCKNNLPDYACPVRTSENCLFLNVYTPHMNGSSPHLRATNASQNALPVMVFIHGGRYDKGSIDSCLYDGHYLAHRGNLVVVTLQYRLGALGFLHVEGSDIDANFAILDQRLALRWVQQNIGAFGGDPRRVTLFGQSAGAASVATHLVAPASKGLYQAAIMESDPMTIPFKRRDDSLTLGKHMAEALVCGNSDPARTADCMRKADLQQILEKQVPVGKKVNINHPMASFLPWSPSLDSDLPMIPVHALHQGKWNKVPLMLGSTKDDAVMFVYFGWPFALPALAYDGVLVALAGKHALSVRQLYGSGLWDSRPQLSRVITDYLFYCPARLVAARNPNVYHYRFDVAPSDGAAWGPTMPFCQKKGVSCHCAELGAVFGSADSCSFTTTEGERVVAGIMMDQWAAFAHTGSPNGRGLPSWPRYTDAAPKTMRYTMGAATLETALQKRECELWDSVNNY